MAFVKTREYFRHRIRNLDRAINGTHAKIRELCQAGADTDMHLVDVQAAYLCSIEKEKAYVIQEWWKWRKKQKGLS
jgi:hypothetical protein